MSGAREERAGAPRHFILGTAGHVDHGKTELVRALTGHDTDRLKEEKERGISIELGFAPLPLSDDVFVGVIDVPGHERFVRQMVAGAGGIDMAMLLVAADEGVMPQTIEHVEVLRSLGIRHGVVVISKSDLASTDTLPLLREEIATLVQGTFLEAAAVVTVSAKTGAGLDELRCALLALARAIEVREATGPFRLPVDRVFHRKGIGVVITGSCYSGRVAVGDEIELLPAGRRARVREIQSFGAKRTEGRAGERLALALHGVRLEEVERGDMLTTPGRFTASRVVDVRLALAATEAIEVTNRERLRIHHGAREVFGRVILLEGDALRAGESAFAQLRLESPIVVEAGDRAVVRKYSPPRVVGGVVVLEPRAEAHRRFDAEVLDRLRLREHGDPESLLARTIERAGALGIAESEADTALLLRLVERGSVTVIAGRVFHRGVLDDLARRAIDIASAHTAQHPLQWGIDKEELRQRLGFPHGAAMFNRVIDAIGARHPLYARENRVRAVSRDLSLSPALARAVDALRERIRASGVAFPSRDDLAAMWWGSEKLADAIQILKDRGEALEVGDGLAHPRSIERCVEVLRGLFAARGEISVGDFKDALGITRKHAIPLLEFFDARQVTVRRGNARVAGPGLPDGKKTGD